MLNDVLAIGTCVLLLAMSIKWCGKSGKRDRTMLAMVAFEVGAIGYMIYHVVAEVVRG